MSRRTTSSDTTRVRGACQDCDWTSTAANALANAARHHDAHDHVVIVDLEKRIVYGTPLTPEDLGQLTIDEERPTTAPPAVNVKVAATELKVAVEGLRDAGAATDGAVRFDDPRLGDHVTIITRLLDGDAVRAALHAVRVPVLDLKVIR